MTTTHPAPLVAAAQRRALAIAAAVVGLAVALALLPGTPAAHAAPASLQVSPGPGQITGGTLLTLTGNLGVRGKRRVVVEQHMGRIGDSWKARAETRGRTKADGSFTLTVIAAAMDGPQGYRYRVRGGKHLTPHVTTHPKAQDVLVKQTSVGVVGQPLEFLVDTIGKGFSSYTELPAPLLPGRTLTLQRRVDPITWENIATTASDARGYATFRTVHRADGDVYRVRAEDWRENGDQIGWTASFPHYVTPEPSSTKVGVARALRGSTAVDEQAARGAKNSGGRSHAHSKYGWFGRDGLTQRFEWELGHSLTTAPDQSRGGRGANYWIDGSDGTGRVTPRNGAILLRSEGYGSAPDGSRGNVWAALTGKGDRFGRWEVRGGTTPLGGGKKHSVRYELVPADRAHEVCGVPSIVLGETAGHGNPLRIGVRAANGKTWGKSLGRVPSGASSYAVQVTKKHITWYLNGKPTATLRKKAALPKGPMVVRIMMAGDSDTRMATTKSTVDWVRSFSLKRGKKVTTKKSLPKGAHGGC
ncbi:hypothetical protein IEQ44_14675 [Nocardioides sp. Y6]|uniref:GH16 domain-containing protein n=1 Tax=Nocardioides malaquae TaxID=2773426 RepID=A0ABR9RXH4_9ACTN|nr:hypothetical protein [Nocardioides malaquae]MBE7325892.1 hypothetical protein [Nocardioides malaquae]